MNNEILKKKGYNIVRTDELADVANRYIGGFGEEIGMGRYTATLWLLQHQYKSEYTLWIIKHLCKSENGLWEELKHSMKDWEKVNEEKILKEI